MKHHRVKQGTPEWKMIRAGIPTASRWDMIVTPSMLKESKSQEKLMNILLAEWFLGEPIEDASSGFMERGRELEPEMFRAYAMDLYAKGSDDEVQEVGFITTDDGRVGCSPDRLVGEKGYAEGKVAAAHTHMGYLRDPASLVTAYKGQVQFGLWVTDREWADLVSYNPVMPMVVVRVPRDDLYITKLAAETRAFCHRLDLEKVELEKKRAEYHKMLEDKAPKLDDDPFATNAEPFDLDGILKGMPG